MSFKIFKSNGKEVILNTDRIISVRFDEENGQTVITCTDEFTVNVDNKEEEVKKMLGTKNPSEGRVGFKPA
jgi:hypothetical protein